MGISAAPPNRPHRRHRPHPDSGIAARFAIVLAVAALATFALAGLSAAWLVIALGEALLSLVLLLLTS